MSSFVLRFEDKIHGVLSGWDRVRFRGTLRRIANLRGMGSFLWERSILLKDFKPWAIGLTEQVRRATEAIAEENDMKVRHGIGNFGGDDVLRFLGRRGNVNQQTAARLQSDLKTRHEGVRLKHALNRNSIKMYDKQESVLRGETTVNDPRDMKVYRSVEGDPSGPKDWKRLRKGVADLHRRAEVSQAANDRYLSALATVDDAETLKDTTASVCRPVQWDGGRSRALNPLAEDDAALLTAVNRGEFAINGFRNRDLAALLDGERPADPAQAKKQAAKVTRQLRLLRAHKLISKVPKTHRYVLTETGRTTINAILAARQASARRLTELAA